MSFNKTKAMRNAERYLTQGKIQAAIGEYKVIVENDPRDINTLNMLGDLYSKCKDNQAAKNCYRQVADYYNTQGFAKKAISIYNKIFRIEPDSIEISEKLAELYRVRGSIAEAKKHYLDISRRYEEKGHREKALEFWGIIGEIDPNNSDIFIKMAEVQWQDNRKEEAARAYIEGGTRLLNANKMEPAVAAFSRALEVLPDNLIAINGFVKAQITLGYPEEAVRTLQGLAKNDPYNREISYLLIDCYFEMDQPEKAEEVIIKIVEREPANYEKLIDLIDVYLEKDDLDSTVRILSMVSEHLLIDGKPETLSTYINEVLARNPEQIEALRLLARFYGWQKDELELQKTLERMVEAARINESIVDERYALSQLLLIIPHNVEHTNRFREINEKYDFDDEVIGEQLLGQRTEDVPDFESFATLNGDEESEGEKGFEFETNGRPENSPGEGIDGVEAGEYLPEVKRVENPDPSEKTLAVGEMDSMTYSHEEPENQNHKKSELSLSDEKEIEEEVESIKFYIEQGYTGLAEKSLNALESKFGKQQQFNDLWTEMGFEVKTVETESSETGNDPGSAEIQTTPENIVELTEEAVVVEEVENIEVVAVENISEQFSENEKSIPPKMIPEDKFDEQESNPEQALNTDFDDFRNDLGLEESSDDENEEDYENHYHHAIAYKEMGLLEEAIREFQDAANCVEVNDGTRRFFRCCSLLSHCFMEKQMPNLALVWLKRAFQIADLSEEEKMGLKYELGNAFEANDEPDKARQQFEEIYGTDVDYRDIKERLENLKNDLVIQ